MQWRSAEPQQALAMQGRAVTGVTFKSVAGKSQRQPADQGIALFLGQHTGGSDRPTATVTANQGDLLTGPATQRQHTIDNQQTRSSWEPLQGPQHRRLRGGTDAKTINLRRTGLTDPPGRRLLVDQGHQGRSAPG